MADLPIPFSPPMVRANLREVENPGTGKTQTRRVLTKLRGFGQIREFDRSDTPGYDWHFRDKAARWHDLTHEELLKALSYRVGDRLYVREHWRADRDYDDLPPSEMGGDESVKYEADGSLETWGWSHADYSEGRFRQGMHMPRWASRLTLIVTDVRVQRVQEISEADAIAEGCRPFFDEANPEIEVGPNGTKHSMAPLRGPIDDFARLWDSINSKRPGCPWSNNPWIAALTFRVIKQNIDQIDEAEDALNEAIERDPTFPLHGGMV